MKDSETKVVSQLAFEGSTSVVDGMPTATQTYATKSAASSTEDPKLVEAPRLDYLKQSQADDEESGRNLNFTRLPQVEKDKIYGILQILDRFCVSDEAYHEITMHDAGANLPRSYLVKKARHDLNELIKVEVLNDAEGAAGACLSFKKMLQMEIDLYMTENYIATPETIKVKLGGDGAEMSRSSSFQLISFSLLNRGRSVLQPTAVRTVAVVCGKETHDTLRDNMSTVFEEVNDLIAAKQMRLSNGMVVPLKFYLAGDVKYKQRILGLMGSTSNYACTTCKVHTQDRWNTSYGEDYYDSGEMRRDLQNDWKDRKFCHRSKPLLS